VLVRTITFPSKTLRDTVGVSTDGPGFLHEIPLAIPKAIRTPVKLRFYKVMSTSESQNLRVPPVLARSGPLNTNNTPPGNHDIRESLKIGEEGAEERAMILQLLKFSVVSPPDINSLIDILPRRAPRTRYSAPQCDFMIW